MDDGTIAVPWRTVGRERFERLVETLIRRRHAVRPLFMRSMVTSVTGVVTLRLRSTGG